MEVSLGHRGKYDALVFATRDQVEQFFQDVLEFEKMLMRIHDTLRQWKLSPMDLQSRVRWERYTKAKEEAFRRTNFPESPWYVVPANDKKRARLNCIHRLLDQIPYEDVPHEEVALPDRVFNENYERAVLPRELYVPSRY